MIKNRVKCPWCVPDTIITVSGMTGHIRGKHPEHLDEWKKMKDEYIKNNVMSTGEKGFMPKKKKEQAEEPLKKEEPKPEVQAPEIKEQPAPKIELPPEPEPKPPVKEGEKQPEKGPSFLDCLDDLDIT